MLRTRTTLPSTITMMHPSISFSSSLFFFEYVSMYEKTRWGRRLGQSTRQAHVTSARLAIPAYETRCWSVTRQPCKYNGVVIALTGFLCWLEWPDVRPRTSAGGSCVLRRVRGFLFWWIFEPRVVRSRRLQDFAIEEGRPHLRAFVFEGGGGECGTCYCLWLYFGISFNTEKNYKKPQE
jgi:hypothetical protein